MASEAPLIPWLEHLRQLYPPQGVVVVGAGNGTGPWIQALRRWNTEHVTLVEADDGQFQHLQRSAADREHWLLRKQVVAHASQSVTFHLASNPAENGLLKPEHLRTLWPNLETREKQTREAITLADLLQGVTPQPNWLWLDCLPAAGLLQGAGKTLDGINVILVRGLQSGAEVLAEYDSASSISAVTRRLQAEGFACMTTEGGHHPGIAHALYVRDYAAQSAQASAQHTRQLQAVQAELRQTRQQAEHAATALARARADAEQARLAAEQAGEQAREAQDRADKAEARAAQASAELVRHAETQPRILGAIQQIGSTLRGAIKNLEANYVRQTDALALDSAVLRTGFGALEDLLTQQQSSLRTLAQQNNQAAITNAMAVTLEGQLAKQSAGGKESLKEIEAHLRDEMKKGLANAVKQVEAFIGIQNYLCSGESPMNFHGWPISPDVGLFLLEKMRERRYGLIIEFGSGTSTALLAKGVDVLSRSPTPANRRTSKTAPDIVSFEHDAKYYNQTRQMLEATGSAGKVNLVHAPIIDWSEDKQHFLYYDCQPTLTALARKYARTRVHILLLVDGPPGATCPNARYPAVPLVFAALGRHQIDVVLDDANRPDERQVIEQWRSFLRKRSIRFVESTIPSEKGTYYLQTSNAQ